MTDKEFWWTIGLYEGEGSCARPIFAIEAKRTGKAQRAITAMVYQKDTEVLLRLKSIWGGTIGRPSRRCSRWQIKGAAAENFLNAIYIGLSTKRKRQVEAALIGLTDRELIPYRDPYGRFRKDVKRGNQ
jgi:hypothetical protein